MKKSEVSSFLSLLKSECQPAVPIFNIILESSNTVGDNIHVSTIWKDFVKCLASACPISSFISTSSCIHDLLKRMNYEDIRKDSTYLSILQHSVPVIFSLVSKLKEQFPRKEFHDLLEVLIEKSLSPFQNSIPFESTISDESDVSYFPSIPVKRGRGRFPHDTHRVGTSKCRKTAEGHPSLLPGVFTLFCKHGNYDFHEHKAS